MSKSSNKLLMVSLIWIFILGIGAMAWKWIFVPKKIAQDKIAAIEEKKQVIAKTSTQTHYKNTVNFAVDSFSGYSIIRSEEFSKELASRSIFLNLIDDGADYSKRLKALQSGEVSMAVFTLDALIKASAVLGDIPATVVAIVDETYGADAMVAYNRTFPNIDAMNDVDTKFVITSDSPSETLSRVVMANFNLNKLSSDPFIKVNGAKEVFSNYRSSKPTDKKVFVLWEPYVSKMLENPEYKTLIDSSKFTGYVVDVIVVSRDVLLKNEDLVKDVVESYFTANFSYRANMNDLILSDSNKVGEPLKLEMAKILTSKIRWKNTQENYAHFGLTNKSGLQHIEDMLKNITKVQLKTDAITADPTAGQVNVMYYDKILRSMFESNFHPGIGVEEIVADKALKELTDDEWKALVPVGTLQVPRLVFARGTATLTAQSEEILASLVDELKLWPRYYLIVRGHSSKIGNVQANQLLAEQRANTTMEWLVKNGVDKTRVKADISEPNGSMTVAFILGEQEY